MEGFCIADDDGIDIEYGPFDTAEDAMNAAGDETMIVKPRLKNFFWTKDAKDFYVPVFIMFLFFFFGFVAISIAQTVDAVVPCTILFFGSLVIGAFACITKFSK